MRVQETVRLTRPMLGFPKHTLGTLSYADAVEAHVVMKGFGVMIVPRDAVEVAPQLRIVGEDTQASLSLPKQLELFPNEASVIATKTDDKIMLTPVMDNAVPLLDTQVVTTKRLLYLAYISTTSFDELCKKIGL